MKRPFPWLLSALLLCAQPLGASTKAATMHYLKALLLQHQGDYGQALREFELASQLDPQSSYILEQAAQLALGAGQAERALELAKRLVELEPKAYKPRFLLGNVQWARGRIQEAQEAFEEALRIEPKSSEALYTLGNLLNAQSPETALKYFEAYLRMNPERAPEAHYQIALLQQRLGRSEEVAVHLKAAVAAEPEYLQARYALAHFYEVTHDTDAALGQYLQILEREPGRASLLNHIGEIRLVRGSEDSAEEYFRKAKAAEPANPEACLWLAILAERKGRFADAARHLSESAALRTDADLHLRWSYYLTQANRLREAVAVLEDARKKWPDNQDLAYFLALGYDDLKEPSSAARLLEEVVGKNPDSRDARFQLAAVYEKLDRMQDSEREFQALLERRPTDATALNYLGYSLTDRGLKLAQAQELISRAVALEPSNGAFRDSLGWSHFKQGRLDPALEELRAALRLLPEDPTVWEHAGDVRQARGEPERAWWSWRMALLHDPENQRVSKKLSAAGGSLDAAESGSRALAWMRRLHGGVVRYGGLCEVSARLGGREFSFQGLLTYRSSGELSLELLGPLYLPVFRIRWSGDDSFAMDRLPIPGVPPEAVRESVYRAFRLLRDYFRGRVFADGGGAELHRGWRTQWVSTPELQLFADGRGALKDLKTSGDVPLRLSLEYLPPREGSRLVPASLSVGGRGFDIGLRLAHPEAEFERQESFEP